MSSNKYIKKNKIADRRILDVHWHYYRKKADLGRQINLSFHFWVMRRHLKRQQASPLIRKNFQKQPKFKEGSYHMTMTKNQKKKIINLSLGYWEGTFENLCIRMREIRYTCNFQLSLSALYRELSSFLLPTTDLKETISTLLELPHPFLMTKKKKVLIFNISWWVLHLYHLPRGEQLLFKRFHVNIQIQSARFN